MHSVHGKGSRSVRNKLETRLGVLAVVWLLAPGVAHAASEREVDALRSELEGTRDELARTQQELARTRDSLATLAQRVDSLSAPAAAPPPATTARIAPVNADNPAVSFVVDTAAFSDTEDSGFGFDLRNGELFVSAPIDPFLRGYASLNGSTDEGFDIEEAALVTTALPWNLTVKGGRFFADVGRLPRWHDEALPFVDRPASLDRLIGGESGAEGVEVSWLAPTDLFLELTGGVYTTIGAENLEALRDEGFLGRRSFNELTWLVRPRTYLDLTDDWNIEIGGTFATVAQGGERSLYGIDATLRHQPGTSELYQGAVIGAEWFWNHQSFAVDPDDASLGTQRFRRNGGYAYVETFWGRRYSAGLLFDYAEALRDETDRERTLSAFATWKPSEFQRLRLQFDQVFAEQSEDDQRLTLQWTAFLGSHSHGFAMR